MSNPQVKFYNEYLIEISGTSRKNPNDKEAFIEKIFRKVLEITIAAFQYQHKSVKITCADITKDPIIIPAHGK